MEYWIFWMSAGFVIYTYVGYPILIWLMARVFPASDAQADTMKKLPTVTVVTPVYNEFNKVGRKLESLRQQSYPAEKLRLIFISDGSTDGTESFLSKQDDVTLICNPQRMGKPYSLNTAMQQVETDIVVFTDARQPLNDNAVDQLVQRLQNPDVGAVSGELVFWNPHSNTGQNVGLYWRYEKWLRKAESRYYSTAGATGALYAIRKNDYQPLPDDTLLDDFEIPIQILRKGKRIVFEPDAQVFDEVQEDVSRERTRKIRTLTGNYQSFQRNPWLFSPLRNPIFFQFISHKVFRLIVPYMLPIILFSSLAVDTVFYQAIFLLQLSFYLGGMAGLFYPVLQKNRIINFIVVFLDLNTAAVIALKNYLSGQFSIKWERT